MNIWEHLGLDAVLPFGTVHLLAELEVLVDPEEALDLETVEC